ncbi:Ankyrin repeat domain-containing protein 63 [Bagarius yarrelli]|uniref:Ankyrin repeat domain-containing protein 63 n=1 Tax=Bagarius yarrelli TaxID=175774 RepID=A0A556TSN6_BAGYA|nr:Ankyrin repeat domain-containing protein 63 [Bagarius yarrelli]
MLKLFEKSDSKTDTQILLDAISKDKMHLARFILDALDGKIVDSKSDGELTPLISSVFLSDSRARVRFMNLLLQKGANVNQQDECGRTALSYACEKGYLDAVKVLVKNNADPEMVDTWGNTALMYAAVAGQSQVVEFLVRAFKRLGLQIDRQNKVGNSAVEVAKFLGHTECLSALMCNSKKVPDQDALDKRFALLRANEGEDTNTEKEKTFEVSYGNKSQSLSRRKYPNLWSRMMSMDSIEELERESETEKDRWTPSPQGCAFSDVLTPKPPQRSCVSQTLKQVAKSCLNNQTPSLSSGAESHSPALPRTHTTGSLSGPLLILLTPIRKANTSDLDKKDVTAMRFDDSYYRKRCSLPTSALGPTPPERPLLKSARKSKSTLKGVASPPHVETADFSTTAFSVLSNRLLRRFTLPELKKAGKEARDGCGAHGEGGETASRGMPRSETFPLSTNHPQVGSKPSIDSISAVKCEFDFQFKANF